MTSKVQEVDKESGWSPKNVGIAIAIIASLAGNITGYLDRREKSTKQEKIAREMYESNERVSEQMRRQTTITLGLESVRQDQKQLKRDLEFVRASFVTFKGVTFPEYKLFLTNRLEEKTKDRISRTDVMEMLAEAKNRRVDLWKTQRTILSTQASMKSRLDAFIEFYANKKSTKQN